jgi:uncharacterized protein
MNIENLNNWNPWWQTKNMPEIFKGIKRDINPLIFKSLKEKEILVFTGIRRCGKTTIMYQIIDYLLKDYDANQILYVNLDDELLKKEKIETIYSEYKQNKNPDKKSFVFLDEIQNIQNWELFLKKYYDLKENIKFIISGSCSNLLTQEYSTLLTGRNLTFKIYPLDFKEYLEFKKIEKKNITTSIKNKIIYELSDFFENGGFPEVFFKEKEIKHILLKQYFYDIIYKDIIRRHNLNSKKITDLAIYLLTNISNPFSINKLRNFTGLATDSIKEYISYLEDAFIISTINHFSYSLKESSQLPKKVYSTDTGLRNIAGFKFSEDTGKIAENSVFIQLKKQEKEIFYWKNKGEIDFIVKNKDQTLTAINVSYTNEIPEREINSLLEFKKKFKKTKELIILTKDTEKKENEIKYIPLWKWLLDIK